MGCLSHCSCSVFQVRLERGKTMKIMAAVVIALASIAVAQTQPKFVDNSPAGSPLGIAKATQTTDGNCLLTIHNKDARSVVAMVIRLTDDGPPPHQFGILHDHFFRDADYIKMHGVDIDVFFPCSGWKTVGMVSRMIRHGSRRPMTAAVAKTKRIQIFSGS